ncbi:response regulator transcription factor [Paludisphaera mucosa]|uniref:Response regulator n=1 Tax=Paludisphaera mucosa TaxID=3030827 RepID=A0ABT6F7N9_9BACT|nr:response regulator [Paludisphaera mucosa]MDG3003454.1 response regulator [Paludisphaera mucosa]
MPTALIVEDEPEANKLLGMLIKLRGYRSASAFNGREAQEQLGRHQPDVLFLDLMLPDLSGYDVCRAVKAAKATCLIPLIIVSARIAQRNRIDSYLAGADEFVAKPYTPDQIFEALKYAEALREQADRERIEGTARLADPDDEASVREVARLRSLILGRTPLDQEEAGRVNALIAQAEDRIVAWSDAHPGGAPGTLHYELSADRLVLTFREPIAWFEELQRTPDDPLFAGLERFQEVSLDRREGRLTLIKQWA